MTDTAPSTRPSTVLVVEDDASIRRLMREVLARAGFAVLEAVDGEAAIGAALEHRPDVVLLDIGLPDVDGLAVLERLKGEPPTAGIPVIMVTAWGETDRVERARRAGAHGYLPKPFDLDELVDRVKAVLA